MTTAKLAVSRRLRSTPYTPRIEALGVSDYSIVNHMVLPKGFRRSVEEDYWHLREHVQMWDVSCQRQVEICGPDAARLVQLMTPRDMSMASTGQCLYAPLIDQHGAMLNDPVVLKLRQDHFWLSIADSDVLLWAKGLSYGLGLDVMVTEPDVSTLAVQGPKAEDMMASVFGGSVKAIRFFRFTMLDIQLQGQSHAILVARSGYSKQGGFEIYLHDSALGLALWDCLWEAGQAFDVAPGSPNLIERVEGGLVSYGNDITRENNPLECGFEQYCQLNGHNECIGLAAIHRIHREGPKRIIRGIKFDSDKCPPCASVWPLGVAGEFAGHITTAIWSPRLGCNVALGMLEKAFWTPGQTVQVQCGDGSVRDGEVVALPFH